MIKESIHQENIPILNAYISNNRDSKFTRKNLIEKRKNRETKMIVGDSKSTLSDSGQ